MLRHLFDTGFLTATAPAPFAASGAALGTKGVPPVTGGAGPPANALDGNGATFADFVVTGATDYEFLRIDLGSAQAVTGVRLTGVSKTGNVQLACVVSNTASLSSPPGAVAIGGTQAVSASMLFDATAAPATGRYVYIFPAAVGAGSYSIGELVVLATTTFSFGVLQSISVTGGFQATDLRTTAHQSNFAIDVAYHSGAIQIEAKHAEIEQGALAKALGCDPVTGVSWTTLTPISASTPLPTLSGLFIGKDSNGKQMRLLCPALHAPGAKLDFALGQFATEGQTFYAYIDATSALVASWELEN